MDKEEVGVTTKEIGDEYEDKILEACKLFEQGYTKRKGSGAIHGDGDITSPKNPGVPQIAIDAKFNSKAKNIVVKSADLKKILTQAAHRERMGLIVTNSSVNEMIAVIPLRFFLELIHRKDK